MRFSLTALLTLTTVAGVLCFLATTTSVVAAFIVSLVITILAPVAMVSMIVYGRGNSRAFGIGACIPMGLLLLLSADVMSKFSLSPKDYSSEADPFGDVGRPLLDPEAEPFGSLVPPGASAPFPLYPRRSWRFEYEANDITKRTWSLSAMAIVGGFLAMAMRAMLHDPSRDLPRQPPNPTGSQPG